jgi:hypothetical protein
MGHATVYPSGGSRLYNRLGRNPALRHDDTARHLEENGIEYCDGVAQMELIAQAIDPGAAPNAAGNVFLLSIFLPLLIGKDAASLLHLQLPVFFTK